jgi:hypothetical protein
MLSLNKVEAKNILCTYYIPLLFHFTHVPLSNSDRLQLFTIINELKKKEMTARLLTASKRMVVVDFEIDMRDGKWNCLEKEGRQSSKISSLLAFIVHTVSL